jgi:hypothetical protein
MPSIKQAKEERLKTLKDAHDLLTFNATPEGAALRDQFRMAIGDIESGWEHARTVQALAQARRIVGGVSR